MNKTQVESSAIASVGYYNKLLEVKMGHGRTYQYFNVPKALFYDFLRAESQGEFFNQNIKGQFRYETVD